MGLSRASWHGIAVNLVCGLLSGVSIGYVAVVLQVNDYVTDCSIYADVEACNSLVRSGCSWKPTAVPQADVNLDLLQLARGESGENTSAGSMSTAPVPHTKAGICAFTHQEARCTDFKTASSCPKEHCYMKYTDGDGSCHFQHGWQAWQKGLFAAAMIVGAMLGSVVAAIMLDRIGRRRSIFVTGLVSFVSAITLTIGWEFASYWVMLTGRTVSGVAVGLVSVIGPMYVGEVVPDRYKQPIGVVFQIFCTVGILASAFCGFVTDVVGNKVEITGTHSIRHWVHMLNALSILSSVVLVPVSHFVQESPIWQPPALRAIEETDRLVGHDADCAPHLSMNAPRTGVLSRAKLVQMAIPACIAALALSAAQQLTGINAIMNYAPTITAAFSLPPLAGNFYVMLWNCVTTFVSVPLAKRFSVRTMFLVASSVATLACFLTAIPTFPGVLRNADLAHGLGAAGIAVFVAAFEIGMGPCFYILSQCIFPVELRSFGCAFTMWTQFAFNLIVNFTYPVAQQALSGGMSGNQNKGQALCFIIFGCLGVLGVAALCFTLPHPQVVETADGDESRADEAEYFTQ